MSLFQDTVNILYRYPRGKLRQIQKQGGIRNTWLIYQARKRMEKASFSLRLAKPESNESPREVHFLTGKKYWYQTVFCMYSLQKTASVPFHFHLYDDGSFDESLIRQIKEQAPGTSIHTIDAIEERLIKAIPEVQFPFLWHKRKVYPHIKKLTDVHAGTSGWKMVLDSDMLFFRRPSAMINWLSNPSEPFFILDTINAYGYSSELMENLASTPIREKVNVGAIGLKSEEINWENLENWGRELEQQEGASYYLEQALSAMLVGQQPATIGSPDDYIVMPNKDQVLSKKGVLHHYVDISKEWYFKKAWTSFSS